MFIVRDRKLVVRDSRITPAKQRFTVCIITGVFENQRARWLQQRNFVTTERENAREMH